MLDSSTPNTPTIPQDKANTSSADGMKTITTRDTWTEMSPTNMKTTTNASTTMKTANDASTQMSTTKTPSLITPWMEMSSIESQQLQTAQKEAIKKILEFSGEENEQDIDEWLFDLTSLFSIMKLTDETKIIMIMSKLTGPALKWYQQQLSSFSSWEETETALQERFKRSTSTNQLIREFLQLRQEENQSIMSYYETVMRKYRRVKKVITEQHAVNVLQNGVKNSLKEYLIRKEEYINSPEDWLKFAQKEDDMQKRVQQQVEDVLQSRSELVFSTATINTQPEKPKYSKEQRWQKGRYQNNEPQPKQQMSGQRNDTCLICNRQNHSTDRCYYKKEKGCFKCGQSDHRVRNCPKLHFFE